MILLIILFVHHVHIYACKNYCLNYNEEDRIELNVRVYIACDVTRSRILKRERHSNGNNYS